MQIVLPRFGQATWYRSLFAGWMTPRFGRYLLSLAFAAAFVAFCWLAAWVMDRRQVYLKVWGHSDVARQ